MAGQLKFAWVVSVGDDARTKSSVWGQVYYSFSIGVLSGK